MLECEESGPRAHRWCWVLPDSRLQRLNSAHSSGFTPAPHGQEATPSRYKLLTRPHISYPGPALNWDSSSPVPSPLARRLFICSSSGFRDEKVPSLTRDLLKCWNKPGVLGVLCINNRERGLLAHKYLDY